MQRKGPSLWRVKNSMVCSATNAVWVNSLRQRLAKARLTKRSSGCAIPSRTFIIRFHSIELGASPRLMWSSCSGACAATQAR